MFDRWLFCFILLLYFSWHPSKVCKGHSSLKFIRLKSYTLISLHICYPTIFFLLFGSPGTMVWSLDTYCCFLPNTMLLTCTCCLLCCYFLAAWCLSFMFEFKYHSQTDSCIKYVPCFRWLFSILEHPLGSWINKQLSLIKYHNNCNFQHCMTPFALFVLFLKNDNAHGAVACA